MVWKWEENHGGRGSTASVIGMTLRTSQKMPGGYGGEAPWGFSVSYAARPPDEIEGNHWQVGVSRGVPDGSNEDDAKRVAEAVAEFIIAEGIPHPNPREQGAQPSRRSIDEAHRDRTYNRLPEGASGHG